LRSSSGGQFASPAASFTLVSPINSNIE
jgi:hypothetical protein